MGAGLAAIVPALGLRQDPALAASDSGAVTVLGAGGKTGRECVEYLASKGTGERSSNETWNAPCWHVSIFSRSFAYMFTPSHDLVASDYDLLTLNLCRVASRCGLGVLFSYSHDTNFEQVRANDAAV